MTGWGNIRKIEPPNREDTQRIFIAVLVTLSIHCLLFQLFMFKNTPVKPDTKDFIAVDLIILPPTPIPVEVISVPNNVIPDVKEDIKPQSPIPTPRTKPLTPQAPIAKNVPQILTSQEPTRSSDTDIENTVPLSPHNDIEPLNPPSTSESHIDEGLKALATELSCLNGFSVECSETRKDVFKDFQMTETEKVWTKKLAHTGLPSEFYGLGEREIRQKLGLHLAGENGLYIPFTNVGIDGRWWDELHGVNKHCEWKIAGPSLEVIKDCPDYLPAVRNETDQRNKPIPANRWNRINDP